MPQLLNVLLGTMSALTFDEMVRLDVFYIENWSVALDVSLLFRTISAVFLARGAY